MNSNNISEISNIMLGRFNELLTMKPGDKLKVPRKMELLSTCDGANGVEVTIKTKQTIVCNASDKNGPRIQFIMEAYLDEDQVKLLNDDTPKPPPSVLAVQPKVAAVVPKAIPTKTAVSTPPEHDPNFVDNVIAGGSSPAPEKEAANALSKMDKVMASRPAGGTNKRRVEEHKDNDDVVGDGFFDSPCSPSPPPPSSSSSKKAKTTTTAAAAPISLRKKSVIDLE